MNDVTACPFEVSLGRAGILGNGKRFEGADLLDAKLNFMPQIAFRGLYNLNVRMIPRRKTA